MAGNRIPQPTEGLFVYRAFLQNSQQATVERHYKEKPLPLSRTGTAAPIGNATLTARKSIFKGR